MILLERILTNDIDKDIITNLSFLKSARFMKIFNNEKTVKSITIYFEKPLYDSIVFNYQMREIDEFNYDNFEISEDNQISIQKNNTDFFKDVVNFIKEKDIKDKFITKLEIDVNKTLS
jgi:hypothetical protein